MIASIRRGAAVAAAGILLGAAACSAPAEPVKIVAVDLTHEVDEHNEPRSARETFAPSSTIYASIATEGTGQATLTAKWTDPSGKVLADESQTINPTKPQRFAFHIPPTAGAHALGRYKVVISIDGKGTRTREFEIRVTQ